MGLERDLELLRDIIAGVSQLVMSINPAISETDYDLNAAPFSEVTAIDNDFILDNIELKFSTTAARGISVTSSDGTVIFEEADNIDKSLIIPGRDLGFDGGENITVALTQTGAACLVDVRLRVRSGSNTLVGAPVLGAGIAIIGSTKEADNYFGEVALGNIPGRSAINKFGHTESVGTTITDIWNDGGLYSFPSDAIQMTISSADGNDDEAGTGARTVEIQGLDSDYNEISEVLIMEGQNGVTSSKSYLRVFRMKVLTAGSTGWNEGNIYFGTGVIAVGVPAIVYAEIVYDSNVGQGENQTLMAIYTIPAGKKGLLWDLNVATTQAKAAEIWLKVRPFGQVFQTKIRTQIIENKHPIVKKLPLLITEKSDIRVSAQTDSGTTDISAAFTLELANI